MSDEPCRHRETSLASLNVRGIGLVFKVAMEESGRVSYSSAASAEYEAVNGVNLEKYDRFKHLLSWVEKQSLFKWKGGLEEL